MRLCLLLAGLLVAASAAAEARMHAPYRGHRIVPGATAPLDGFTAPAAAYSMRRLKSSYAGPAIRLRRASDNAEQDIGFLGFTGFTGAPIDTAAAAAFCNATTCFVKIRYDQSGNAKDLTQATAANQPQFIFNCNGSLPCLRTTVDTQLMATAAGAVTSVAPVTMSSVAIRSSGAAFCRTMNWALHQIYAYPSALNAWVLQSGGTQLVRDTAPENAWHALIGLINGAATVFRIDDLPELTANLTVNPGPDAVQAPIGPTAGTVCSFAEDIVWSGYALTAGERAALVANQHSFWNF